MGWLWSSPASPTESLGSSRTDTSPAPAQQNHVESSAANMESPPSEPQRQSTRDEIAELEFQSLLEELEADVRPTSTKYHRVPKSPPTQSTISKPSNQTLEEELLPTEMSCRQAFDAAFYCQSLGGQFNNLYRYGGIRSCSENWKDFWFCMRTKSYIPEQKEGAIKSQIDAPAETSASKVLWGDSLFGLLANMLEIGMIREHYRRKSLKYKLGPSSEDIWEARDKRLEWAEAFSEPVEAPPGSDEEWNRRESLRREGRVEGTT